MKKKQVWLLGGIALLLFVLFPNLVSGKNNTMTFAEFIASLEGFSAVPYWDVSRWSWGYGTQAPGPSGTITREQALSDLMEHVQVDYDYLRPMITRELTQNQWNALLSFSYNEGPGNADNLIYDINSGDDRTLELHWKKYIYADGVVNEALIERRNKEWLMWAS